MSERGRRSNGSFRLADRLTAARRKRFVGRVGELELFRSALLEPEPPFAVLHVYGPGGVGKTALLAEYARIAEETGLPAVILDGHTLDPSPAEFLFALRQALGLTEDASPLEALARHSRSVLLVDTYETLAPLDAWLRETFLPQLPGRSLVVIAGRNPPAPAWRTEPGWQDLVRIVSLRNLRPEESRAYLQARGVPEARHPAALEFTHGHPLALSLVADVLSQGDEQAAFSPEREPDVVRALLERFLQQIPSPKHRQALEACALARVTTEALLAGIVGAEDAHELFTWLRELSFIEHGPQGIFPHDLVREVLDADLRWRNPEDYRELDRKVRRHLGRRLHATSGRAQQQVCFDILYRLRHHPLTKPFHDWQSLGSAYIEPAAAPDFPLILAMVGRHEGDQSARIAAYWLQRQPHAFTVFRGIGNEPIGFVSMLALHEPTAQDLAADPAAQAAWDFVRRSGPARPGEELLHLRFWMDRDAYQDLSPTTNLIAATFILRWLTNPALAWSFLAVADADYWRPLFTFLNLQRSPAAEFVVGGRPYAVYTHDWRVEPTRVWASVIAERTLANDLTVEMIEAARPAPLVVLSQPDFEEAARRALRDYHRPDALAANPLLRSRLAREKAGTAPTPATLRALLRDAAASLQANPRSEKLYRALRRTYFEPAATQELAAESLGLPFGTYRSHLAAAIERLTEWLWQRELYGTEG